jgi:uncharacterized cofD-like protein
MFKFLDRGIKWLSPGMKIKRWLFLSWLGLILFSLGLILMVNPTIPINIELDLSKGLNISTRMVDLIFVLTGFVLIILGIRQWFMSIYNVLVPYESKKLVDVLYEKRQLGHGIKLVTIGGGTGLSSLLQGLKAYTSNLVAVVTVSDDGGSSGRLRKELGVLPPGDIRNCLVALANDESKLSELFQYRFPEGEGLGGHNFGNLLLLALTGIAGNFDKAIKLSSKILAIRGKVIPASLTSPTLVAEYEDGTIIEGESQIPKAHKTIKSIYLKPSNCESPPEVIAAIKEADAIIIGPGSIYTSIMPNLLVEGIVDALTESLGIKLYVCNVMTQPGESDSFKASDHLKAIFKQIKPLFIDYVVINNVMPSPKLLEKYKANGAYPVEADVKDLEKLGVKVVTGDLISETDLVRHDSKKLAELIVKLILEKKSKTQEKTAA